MARGPPRGPHSSRPRHSNLLDCSILEGMGALFQCVRPKHPYRRGILKQHYQFRTPSSSLDFSERANTWSHAHLVRVVWSQSGKYYAKNLSSLKLKPPKMIYWLAFKIFWFENNQLYGTSQNKLSINWICTGKIWTNNIEFTSEVAPQKL